jgi:tRNA (guanine-N7-)-methyltransferase
VIEILTGSYRVIDPTFGQRPSAIELDLGCGKGRFCLELARRYPERLILGSDVMLGRLRRVDRKATRRGLANLVLLRADSLDLVSYLLPPQCVDRIHLLCPDPWPKSRHRSRRLVTTDFVARLARVLKPGGALHMSTDYLPYFEDWRGILGAFPAFREEPDAMADVVDLQTDFEIQWRGEGREVPHLAFRFRPVAALDSGSGPAVADTVCR